MADLKISALPAATTPLAGTEVLPIVQSGSTVKVSVANLTAGREVSAESILITNNVGIGTTSPLVRLEVAGTTGANQAIVTASISGTTMTVTAVSSGTIVVGNLIHGTNVEPYTRVTAFGTGTGGLGTYTVSVSQTVTSTTVSVNETYGNTIIRITNTDLTENTGQPTGVLQFFTSDSSSPTEGVGAYVAAMSESTTPDTALVFGTRNDTGGGVDANERMRIDSAGAVGIGGTPAAGQTLSLTKSVTGAVTSNVLNNAGTIASDVTTTARGYFSSFGTAAAAFTLTTLEHFRANQTTIGATSAVTQQFGFNADSTLIGATTNYGHYSAIAAAANRYNFYAAGTADNFFAGKVGIGSVAGASATVNISNNLTGSTFFSALLNNGVIQSDVTSTVNCYASSMATQAAVFTLSDLRHYNAAQATIGAGSVVTNQFGFITQATLTGATNNYGFYSNIAAAANRWNFYANGTARNYMAADLTVNGATAIPAGGTAGAGLMVSTTANFGVFFGSGAPTLSAAKGSLYLRSDGSTVNDRMYVNTNGSTTWTNVVTSA